MVLIEIYIYIYNLSRVEYGFQWNMIPGGSQGGSHRYVTCPECKMVFSGT